MQAKEVLEYLLTTDTFLDQVLAQRPRRVHELIQPLTAAICHKRLCSITLLLVSSVRLAGCLSARVSCRHKGSVHRRALPASAMEPIHQTWDATGATLLLHLV